MAKELPFVSLDAVTGTGAGAVYDLESVSNAFTLVAWGTGTGTLGTIDLDGSHDGVNWVDGIESITNVGTSPQQVTTSYLNTASPAPFFRYVRANVTSYGGSATSLSATIAASVN